MSSYRLRILFVERLRPASRKRPIPTTGNAMIRMIHGSFVLEALSLLYMTSASTKAAIVMSLVIHSTAKVRWLIWRVRSSISSKIMTVVKRNLPTPVFTSAFFSTVFILDFKLYPY